MLKAIIVDDEINGIKFLQYLISKNYKDITIIGHETIPKRAVDLIEQLRPDVVFLDIEMPDMNGFEVLEKLKHLSFHVIFTTAYDNYAIKAFKYNTVDYLLKPIIDEELKEAINKLTMKANTSLRDRSIDKLLEKIDNVQNQKKIAINSQNETIYIDIQRIIRLESDSNYTNIILIDGKKITSTKTLKEYEHLLSADIFYRTHNTVIVNIDHIEKFIKMDGGYIIMKDNVQVPVSRDKRQNLLALLAAR